MKKIIKFYADWCNPCRVYSKTWNEVTANYKDQIQFVDINVDSDTTGLAAKYKIQSIPTTILLREDGSTLKKSGILSPNELTELILS